MARDDGPIDLETVSRNQMEPVFAIYAEGTIAFANERFYTISGTSPEDVLGAEYERFEAVVEYGFELFRSAVESVLAGESIEERVELSMIHPEGAPVPRRLPAETRITPIESGGQLVGALVSLRTIRTRKKYEKQLKQQNERLSEFASVVAHDLRNPLNVAEGHLRLAAAECDSAHLESMDDAIARMWAIIEDTLTLAKQGRHVGEKERVPLDAFVDRCWTTVGTADATLENDAGAAVLADSDRLQNLFENLFRNAVEHAGESATVRVGLLDGRGFYVEDDGAGIPTEERDRVFDLGHSTADRGTGYGLAIVKWIADAHGWEVSVTDGTEGGARFEFTDVEFAR